MGVELYGPISINPLLGGQALTAGTLAIANNAAGSRFLTKFTWTNAQIVALGGVLAGDISVCTLPARCVVSRAWMVVTGTAAGVTTLTGAIGRVAAGYIDYIIASDLKAAPNTIYGDLVAELGTNLNTFVGDLSSWTATTLINFHLISTVQNLDQTTGSTGNIYLETTILP